jgi:hypothetical protein
MSLLRSEFDVANRWEFGWKIPPVKAMPIDFKLLKSLGLRLS